MAAIVTAMLQHRRSRTSIMFDFGVTEGTFSEPEKVKYQIDLNRYRRSDLSVFLGGGYARQELFDLELTSCESKGMNVSHKKFGYMWQ